MVARFDAPGQVRAWQAVTLDAGASTGRQLPGRLSRGAKALKTIGNAAKLLEIDIHTSSQAMEAADDAADALDFSQAYEWLAPAAVTRT